MRDIKNVFAFRYIFMNQIFFLHRNGWYLMFYLFAQPIFPKFRAINYHKTTVCTHAIQHSNYVLYSIKYFSYFCLVLNLWCFIYLYIYIYAYHWFVVCFRRLKVEVTLYIMFYIQPHNLNQKFTHSVYKYVCNFHQHEWILDNKF